MRSNSQGSAGGSELQWAELGDDFKLLLVLLCLVCAVDGGDIILLPSSFHALEQDLKLTPIILSHMAFAGAMSTAVFAPVWGLLADKAILTRRALLAFGCAGWGLLTILCAEARGPQLFLFLRALLGAMLACLGPIAAGLIADATPEHYTGRVFGLMFSSMKVGILITGVLATGFASQRVFGMQGWRFAFRFVGILSCAMGALIAVKMPEPPRRASQPKIGDSRYEGVRHNFSGTLREVTKYFRVPTVTLLTVQGIFGTVPWNALGFATMYLQVQGLNDAQASAILAIYQCTSIAGHLCGGIIADASSARFPQHGRVFVAQFSVAAGIPLSFLMFGVFAPSTVSFPYYAILFAILGFVSTWFPAASMPIISELVGGESRSTVLALMQAAGGSSAAIFGAPAVGYLAEKCFGYHLDATPHAKHTDAQLNAANARALGNSLLIATVAPWCTCLLIVSFVHWSYPRDFRNLKAVRHLESCTDGTVQLADFSSPGKVGAVDDAKST